MSTFKGPWELNVSYNIDDIILKNDEHYICLIQHVSNNLVYPGHQEEIYWLKLNCLTEKTEKSMSNKNKRKIEETEKEIKSFKKQKRINNNIDELKDKLLLLNVDIQTKVFLMDKWETIDNSRGSEYDKGKNWINTVLNIPFGKNIPFKISKNDSSKNINIYFDKIRKSLDEKIYGLDLVKDEIIEFLARKIANPKSKGHVLALQGAAGVGKTKLIKSLGEALSLPFHQINFGGLNDASLLIGHSETYVGAKPGKIVEILTNSGCMNPIMYFDEIDKIAEYKGKEINGILTHLLDEEQNESFQDSYLSNVNLDLSKVFFIIAFNDINKINPIVLNRMKVIHIEDPSIESKIIIAEKMIPEIIKDLKFNKNIYIKFDKELLYYFISKIEKEAGVRQLKKNLEKIFNKLNYLVLTEKYLIDKSLKISKNKINTISVTEEFINDNLNIKPNNESYLHMYI
jgi:ATP-dependent Lon protease